MAWFLLLASHRIASRVTAGLAAGVCAAVVVAAQGRGGLFGCILSLTVLGVWAMRRQHDHRAATLAVTVGMVAAVSGSAVVLALRSSNALYRARILALLSAPQNDPNYIARTQLWREGYANAVSQPAWIGSISPEYASVSTWNTHNLWLFAALYLRLAWIPWSRMDPARFGITYVSGLRSRDADCSGLSFLGFALLLDILAAGMFLTAGVGAVLRCPCLGTALDHIGRYPECPPCRAFCFAGTPEGAGPRTPEADALRKTAE